MTGYHLAGSSHSLLMSLWYHQELLPKKGLTAESCSFRSLGSSKQRAGPSAMGHLNHPNDLEDCTPFEL